jgi:putative membrane protein
MWQCGPWTSGTWFGGWGMMPFGGLFSLLILVLVIGVAVALFRGAAGRNRSTRSPGLDALEERYAKGEIQRDEYLQKKADLHG